MYNRAFDAFNNQEKRLKMRRVLYQKAPLITKAQIEKILDSLDYDHQYHIKSTFNEQKFKNMITNEHVFKSEKEFICEVTCIYGRFIPGYYSRKDQTTQHIPSQILECAPCAAIKTSLIKSRHSAKILHYILLYFPDRN